MTAMNSSLATQQPSHSEQEYSAFCEYLEKSTGITLGANKAYLVTNRLSSILKTYGISSLSEAMKRMQSASDKYLKLEIVDAMTTNETSWFRDQYPFVYLAETLLPQLTGTRISTPRIWSAACSYGHEAYSISMVIDEYQARNPGAFPSGVQVIATDISNRVLKTAAEGEFDRLSMARGLSADRKQKYFTHTGDDTYKVHEKIKSRVRFQNLNLLESYAMLGKFDIIFCRNVLIYFSNENKSQIMSKFAQSLNSQGTLVLGASETVTNYSEAFEMVKCPRGIVYRHV